MKIKEAILPMKIKEAIPSHEDQGGNPYYEAIPSMK